MRLVRALLAAGLVLAACSPTADGDPPASSASVASPSGSVAPSLAEGQFVNPVLDRDFPDPGVLVVDGTYYAYATEGGGRHIQVASSPDLVTWEYLGEALPSLPTWSTGMTWAPEVIETDAGFVMYYTARDPATQRPDGSGTQCITVAVADAPEGPFVDDSDAPLVCQADMGGTIDATPFRDTDGTLYLVYKNDGNCCGRITRFWGQPLSEDGLSLEGEPVDLGLENDNAWEAHVIEAPWIVLRDGTYYLFYSANDYANDRYAVGYATASLVLGPYVDAEENPILATPADDGPDVAYGPGHQSVVTGPDGEPWIIYHAWDQLFQQRAMWIDEVRFEDGRPVIDGPDGTAQEAP
ncbi:MAG: glycoside hydrolase family 43 protein [Candidatus Limnocylindria bacterium]